MFRRGKLVDEYREFTRELLLRLERAAAEIREENRIHREELRAHREESRAYHERENKRLDDILADSRAHRDALLHVLDKLDNGGTAPAA